MTSRLSVLSEAEISAIHDASLSILRDVGVQLPDSEVLGVLAEAGARVDFSREVARIPESLVVEALERAGKRFILYGRDRAKMARFGYGDFVLVSSPGQFSRMVGRDGIPPARTPGAASWWVTRWSTSPSWAPWAWPSISRPPSAMCGWRRSWSRGRASRPTSGWPTALPSATF